MCRKRSKQSGIRRTNGCTELHARPASCTNNSGGYEELPDINMEDLEGCDTLVRRLTEKECERLQGFPDDFTNLGDWVDSKGKKHKDASSPRYKALGNAIALPFWHWLLGRIAEQYKDQEEQPTMGSLFCGIGGFDLCWHMVGGKTVWCSEIEEFPIAVMKRHFGDEDAGIEGDVDEYLQKPLYWMND